MAQDNTLWPVTKKGNPKFYGLATASVIAQSEGKLILITAATMAEPVIEKAVEELAVKKALDDNPGVPSEAVKPSDIKRRPIAPQPSQS